MMDTLLSNFRVVLVGTLYHGNVGSVRIGRISCIFE